MTLKRGIAPKPTQDRRLSAAGLQEQLDHRTRELNEALEQQAATSEVLHVISSAPGKLEPVFKAILTRATRICQAKFGNLWLREGDNVRIAATHGAPSAYREYLKAEPVVVPAPGSAMARVVSNREVVQIDDIRKAPTHGMKMRLATIKLAKARSLVGVPMLKENEVIGIIAIYRQEVRPFSDKQVDLLKNFAAQAVIAIENARLLNELRQRTDDLSQRTADLTESLQQQTATSDVLKVISRSTFDLPKVLSALLESAARLCNADSGTILRPTGKDASYYHVASYRHTPEFNEYLKNLTFAPGRSGVVSRVLLEGKSVQIADVLADPEYALLEIAKLGDFRTILGVPLLREGIPIGVLLLQRAAVQPFTEKQIKLVETFADQAVIAIENVRLFEAEQQRTRELSESLEQQTASSEVLQVISSSPGDLQPVFETMLQNAVRICGAKFGNIFRWDGDALHLVATHNIPPAFAELRRRSPFRPGPENDIGRMVATKAVVHVADLAADRRYTERRDPAAVAAVELGGVRTFVAVPMLKENELIGALIVYRQEVRPFTDKQIELVTNFAAQAVIAVENARLLNELRQRTDDLTERTADLTKSLEQQTATSEVLQVISSSPGDLQPVFETMVQNAVRICDAKWGNIHRWDGDALHLLATHNTPPAFAEARRRSPNPANPKTSLGRMVATKAVVHVADAAAEPGYVEQHDQTTVAAVELGGARTCLYVPMLKESDLIGAVILAREEVRPFTDKQIALVKNFAAQAVIAIENTRLLNELRQRTSDLTERTADLTEALEQQTATSEVLRVISSSTGDLEPVFATMLEKAVRMCDATFGNIYRWQDGALHLVAAHNTPPALAEARRHSPLRPGTNEPIGGRMIANKTVVQAADMRAEKAYADRDPYVVAGVELGGVRTVLMVPMLKDNELIGAFSVYRQEVRPFTDKQIALVTSFAAQAVIAIENTRLLSELRESLEQQTATSEVLGVISTSPSELQPVFSAILANGARLCEANFGILALYDDGKFRVAAMHNVPHAYAELRRREPVIDAGPRSASARLAATKDVIHILDYAAEVPDNPAVRLGGVRSFVGVPMLKEDEFVGVIWIYRQEVRPFTDKQIALLKNFADQAVIAIENTRLLSELHQRTDELGRSVSELRALGEVSQAVNSTLDLATVLSTIVSKAVQLSSTEAGAIYVFDEQQREFHLRATYGMEQELINALTQQHIGLHDTNIKLALAQGEPIQVPDLREGAPSAVNEVILRAGFRALLVAPLLRGEDVVGMLVIRRKTPGAFPQNTVDLIKTFAAQSVLAIQNARLFDSVETRTRELAKSLGDLRTAQDRLVQTEKLASLGQLTAGIAHEIKNPLNFVNNFSSVSVELIDELREALGGAHLDNKLRAEIGEIADTLQGNLDKVVQHGKRADAIVKNMLLHSRQGSGEHRPVDINALVEESINLAYHGARAEKQGFNITLERSFDPAAGEVDLYPQEITRVLLNLISNGFYAATMRKAEASGGDYEPTLTAATKNLGDRVEIRIRDNGTGIPPEVKEKLFNPFFTTKPAGEGTGLGLSISHDIIVKQHAGSIEADTKLGAFTEFRIVLPRAAAFLGIAGGQA